MDDKRLNFLNNLMCSIPHDLYKQSHQAIIAWYDFGTQSLLKNVAERIGVTPEDLLFWWNN